MTIASLLDRDRALMRHAEPLEIAVMMPAGAKAGSEALFVERRDSLVRPVEIARNDALARAIDIQRAMRRRRAKPVPPRPTRAVEPGPRIDQHRLAVEIERQRQRVGVPVRRDGEIAERAMIES